MISADWIIENDICHILCVALEFFIKRRWFRLFIAAYLSNIKQIGSGLTCPKLAKWMSQLWTARSQQNDQFENLCTSSHGKARNIKFGRQLNIKKVPLDTLPREVVISLARIHVTNLSVSSFRGATVIKFGQ